MMRMREGDERPTMQMREGGDERPTTQMRE